MRSRDYLQAIDKRDRQRAAEESQAAAYKELQAKFAERLRKQEN